MHKSRFHPVDPGLPGTDGWQSGIGFQGDGEEEGDSWFPSFRSVSIFSASDTASYPSGKLAVSPVAAKAGNLRIPDPGQEDPLSPMTCGGTLDDQPLRRTRSPEGLRRSPSTDFVVSPGFILWCGWFCRGNIDWDPFTDHSRIWRFPLSIVQFLLLGNLDQASPMIFGSLDIKGDSKMITRSSFWRRRCLSPGGEQNRAKGSIIWYHEFIISQPGYFLSYGWEEKPGFFSSLILLKWDQILEIFPGRGRGGKDGMKEIAYFDRSGSGIPEE